jgi:hypothetical protein
MQLEKCFPILTSTETVAFLHTYFTPQCRLFWAREELQDTSNADTRFNTHALLLQPTRCNFISDSIQRKAGLSRSMCYSCLPLSLSLPFFWFGQRSSNIFCVHYSRVYTTPSYCFYPMCQFKLIFSYCHPQYYLLQSP